MEAYLLKKYPPYSGAASVGQSYYGLKLPGTAGNYISTPDSVLNSITGDIDIRVCLKMVDWTPATNMSPIAKMGAAGQRSWYLTVEGSNRLSFGFYRDGTNQEYKQSSIGPTIPFADGTAGWLRLTLDVDNGAGGHDLKFYTSVDGITWLQYGTTVTTAGVTSIFDSTSAIQLGDDTIGDRLNGTIYYAEVRNGIDGPVVVKFDASQVVSTGAMLPASINGWTWNGSALYKRDDYVRLPGTAGNYLSFPDTAGNSVTGDIDIRVKLSMDDWTPAAEIVLLMKWGAVGQQSYILTTGSGSAGRLRAYLSADGTAQVTQQSSVAVPFTDVQVGWARFTWVNATDVGQFFTSLDGVTWTQLGTDVSLVGAGIFDSTAVVQIGNNAGGNYLAGNVYYAEVRNGINGPVVASFNAADFADVQTPWTINGAGWSWESSTFTAKPVTALQLPGTTGNYVSTPDTAGNSVTGDIDIRVKAALSDWSPATDHYLVSHWQATGNQKSFVLYLPAGTGALGALFSVDGSTTLAVGSTSISGIVDASTKWLRVTRISSTGVVQFYLSDDGIAWSPLGVPAATTSGVLFDSTQMLEIGSVNNGAAAAVNGKIHYAEVRNGIDGPVVAKFDSTNIARTGTRTPTTTVQPGGTPNLLTPAAASFEDGTVGGWVTGTLTPTLANSAAQALDGTKSLLITATAVGTFDATSAVGTGGMPVIPGKLYTASLQMRAALVATAFDLSKTKITWYNIAGSVVSSTNANSINPGTGAWTLSTLDDLAPPTARFASVGARVAGTVAPVIGDAVYVDRISLVEAAEVWTMNGAAWDLVAV